MEAHVNNNIIFIVITKGLNQDKLELLNFKITELLSIYLLRSPKILIIFGSIKVDPADGHKISLLLNTVLNTSKAKQENIKMLTNNDFTRNYIIGKKEFRNIEIFSSLQFAMDNIQSWVNPNLDSGKHSKDILNKMLAAEIKKSMDGTVINAPAAHAPHAAVNENFEIARRLVHNLLIAVIDDDFVIKVNGHDC